MNNPLALIIEDEVDVATLVSHALKSLGFETEVFQAGDKALTRLAVIVPDVVLLDLNLPHGVSGADILRQIRADARLMATHVILLTGQPHIAEPLRDEADLVLLKPFSIDQLTDLVTRLRPGSASG